MSNDTTKFVTMDGNEACAYVAYAFTEVAAIYPITPSSPMAGKTDAWSAKGKKNLFGQTVSLVEMQSEAGAIGAIHGALEAGALATSFTSSQGLMLMIPVLHRISGERLPGVLHVASRTVGTHALSIFGDHSDVMNCRQTGFAMLSTASSQEIMDLAPVAHLAAIEGRIPFLHFFDGFRTSHELSKVEPIPYDAFASLLPRDALAAFKSTALNPEHPRLHATVQNGDVYFQVREANNPFYDALPDIVQKFMDRIGDLTGRRYRLFDYYGAPDAEDVIVAMGSVAGTVRETVDHLLAQGRKVGFVQVHLFRPFSAKHFLAALPPTTRRIAVLDRCKEMGSAGEPLFQDVCTVVQTSWSSQFAVCSSQFAEQKKLETANGELQTPPAVFGGRYGLSSKDVDPAQILAVFDNLAAPEPKANFTIGIVDDVTHLSLPVAGPLYPDDEHLVACKFWGLGSDGTVGANKNTVEIINSHTPKYAQAYFEYDAKKSFGVTKSHLRFGDRPIRGSYYVKAADFIGCHNETYIAKYDIAGELKEGGTLLLNCSWTPEETPSRLPAHVRAALAAKKAKLYVIDAVKIAESLGLGSHINTVLQAAFFALSGVIPADEAAGYMKDAAKKTYFAKGEDVVARNVAAIDAGLTAFREVRLDQPEESAVGSSQSEVVSKGDVPPVVKNLLEPINAQKGDDLPVSAFKGYEDGTIEMGLTAWEKRGIATHVPVWDPSKCIQCNHCSLVCPHAVIRPFLLDADEAAKAPEGFKTLPATGAKDLHFTLQVSALDCTGCGVCANSCIAKEKALTMHSVHEDGVMPPPEHWDFALSLSDKSDRFAPTNNKAVQFRQPLVEFSAACAGCGETPYAKLLTQLFGDRVYWANATGCSQAWGSPMPGIPYTVNKRGFGPAWTNSLFENNAEFALGMALSVKQQRALARQRGEELLATLAESSQFAVCSSQSSVESAQLPEQEELETANGERQTASRAALRAALEAWLTAFDDFEGSRAAADALIPALRDFIAERSSQFAVGSSQLAGQEKLETANGERQTAESCGALASALLDAADQLAKKTFWMFGGDGWAYDIGFGGLDHVLASGENLNVLIVDTEVYSNTGGQSSKATPIGAVAQFANAGKRTQKKDLGRIFMSYGNVYVAQVAMGADPNQLLKALREAESYDGPSLVIAYAPCQAHGIRRGMSGTQQEMKDAVAAGYWPLYRYDPRKKDAPFTLDSKAPTMAYEDFLKGETRFLALTRTFPDNAKTLFASGAEHARAQREALERLQQNQGSQT